MNQSVWSVVALGIAVVMLPLIVPSSGGDGTGSTIFELLTSITPVIGVTFTAAVFGLLIVFFGSDSGF
jgi:predicted polyphosphate/ATP-dependent NAD kinase